MSDPLTIYIAGPYTADTEEQIRENVNAAIDAAFIIFPKGHFPYVPHLTHFIDQRAKERGVNLRWEIISSETWFRWRYVMLCSISGVQEEQTWSFKLQKNGAKESSIHWMKSLGSMVPLNKIRQIP